MKNKLTISLFTFFLVFGLNTLSHATELPVSVEIKTDKTAYAPGETIYYHIQINNESDEYASIGGTVNNVITVSFDLATDVYGRTRNHYSEVNGTNHPSNSGASAKSRASVAYGDMVLSVPPYGDPDGPLSPVDPGPYFVKATLPINILGIETDVQARTVVHVIVPPAQSNIDDVLNGIDGLSQQSTNIQQNQSVVQQMLKKIIEMLKKISPIKDPLVIESAN